MNVVVRFVLYSSTTDVISLLYKKINTHLAVQKVLNIKTNANLKVDFH